MKAQPGKIQNVKQIQTDRKHKLLRAIPIVLISNTIVLALEGWFLQRT